MSTNRREFIKGTAWMGAAAALASANVASAATKLCAPGSMSTFADKPLKTVRVGVVGLGMRGPGAVHRLAAIPGVEVVALCDLCKIRVGNQQNYLKKHGKKPARAF